MTTKAVGKGTGLGLAIARQIVVEKHFGMLEVNSTLGAVHNLQFHCHVEHYLGNL
ncbi:MAG: hypothetical protein WCF82_26720 [Microcoleus sp.]